MRVFVCLTAALVASAALAVSNSQAAGNAEDGASTFNRTCAACHATAADAPNRIGPTLFGVVGRKSASVPGFRYSEANKKAGLTWTPETLDKYLADPKGTVPGTTMVFAGVKKDDERANLIAYLETLK
ncbi:MAG TPA: cytochrome c family protein [Alphaproteobacteria bacterium]